MRAYVFPGQGAQFSGMGKDLYDQYPVAKELFAEADRLLGFSLSDIMFHGSEEDLKQTKVTQPAVFLHSYIAYRCLAAGDPDMVAGHSLGEFTALAVNGSLAFEDALLLVSKRAQAMQKACERQESGMAVVLKFEDAITERVCAEIQDEVVVPANYNSPQQLVISGSLKGLELAMERLREAGAKRMMLLNVGGAFHSPLMQPAKDELQAAIEKTEFQTPKCPVYQNVDGKPHTDAAEIKQNLIAQLTSSVRWTQCVQNMIADGADDFTECGPGKALQGMIAKINREVSAHGIE